MSTDMERPSLEETGAIGFLADGGVFYCSSACARRAGRADGHAVDQEEFDGLCQSDRLVAGALCPACGGEVAVSWPEHAQE